MSSENFEELTPPMPPAMKAITLTYVRYHRGDPLGLFLAWVSLIPVFISLGGFVSHFLFRREIQGLCFTLGLIISQFLNELVKSSVQESRPDTCALLEACDSHGWPSSHSQYMFFFATVINWSQFVFIYWIKVISSYILLKLRRRIPTLFNWNC